MLGHSLKPWDEVENLQNVVTGFVLILTHLSMDPKLVQDVELNMNKKYWWWKEKSKREIDKLGREMKFNHIINVIWWLYMDLN